MGPRSGLAWSAALLLLAGAVLLAPHGAVDRAATLPLFWRGVAVMGAGFALSWWLEFLPPWLFWAVALATRLILLPMEPGDDVWRYLWEGAIQLHGFSPFHLAPEDPALAGLRTAWWPLINHPGTTAIYPPLAQLLFRALAAIAPAVILFKLAFLAADLAVCALLVRCFGCGRAALYGWNPLVIYAFAGGAHYDSLFLLPLVAAWLLQEGRLGAGLRRPWLWSSLLLGISVAIKWVSLPLLLAPMAAAWRRDRRWAVLPILLAGLLPLLLGAWLFCSDLACPLVPTGSMFVTRGRSAEWLPHLLGRIVPASRASNAPHVLLLLLLLVVLLRRARSPGEFQRGYWLGLLLISPIVHAWYLCWPIPFFVPRGNWGVRFVSLSGFVYFVLPSGGPEWLLSDPERLTLWLPLLLGAPWNGWPPPPDPSTQRSGG